MKKRLALFFLVVVALIAAEYYFGIRSRENSDTVVVSGNIELTDAQLSFKIPGRLAERLVDEGETIEAGQVVARLDSADQELMVSEAEANLAYAKSVLAELEAGSRAQEIRQAKAAVEQAKAMLEELERGSRRQEIATAEDMLEQAKAEAERLTKDRRRYAELYAQGAVSEQHYDAVRTAAVVAVEQYEAAQESLDLVVEGPRKEKIEQARAALEQAEERYALVQEGPRKESIEQARAKVAVAEQTLRKAQQQLEYTELTAPFDGVVLSKSAEPGEYLNPGTPVITVGEMDHVWLRAYVNETDLGCISHNQEVEITTDSYPGRTYPGRIAFIASEAEFTPKTVQTQDERVKLMYRIKVDIENPHHELKLGMPADARIDVAS